MAEKKLRDETWRIKWLLLYIAVVILLIALLVVTIIFLDNGIGKIFAIIYESFVLLFAIALPIAVEVNCRKDSKKRIAIYISKEEHQEFLRQTKNCNIYAK